MIHRFCLAAFVLVLAGLSSHAQVNSPSRPLTLLSSQGRQVLPTMLINGHEFVSLDDLANIFAITVREDNLAGGITVSYQGNTIVLSVEQPLASINGRLVTLPAPLTYLANQAFVPIEFLSRALTAIYDLKIELRATSRLLLLGPVNVPRLTVTLQNQDSFTSLILELTPAIPVSATTDPSKIILEVEADAIDAELPMTGEGLVETLGLGNQPNTIVIDLQSAAGLPTTNIADGTLSTLVTINVPLANANLTPSVTPEQISQEPITPPSTSPISITPPRAVLQTIVLDPGHGGEDIGARGTGGTLEKQITLDIARSLKTMVESRLGIRVLLTRDDDRDVNLDERAAMANHSKADLFLSIHVNAALSPALAGAEIFYLAIDREVEEARNTTVAMSTSLPVVGGGSRSIDIIGWEMAQASHVENSAVLAGILENSLQGQIPLQPSAVKQAPLRVLVGANMPAVLIEIGYLTNREQEQLVSSPGFQASVTQALFSSILRFRQFLEDNQ